MSAFAGLEHYSVGLSCELIESSAPWAEGLNKNISTCTAKAHWAVHTSLKKNLCFPYKGIDLFNPRTIVRFCLVRVDEISPEA